MLKKSDLNDKEYELINAVINNDDIRLGILLGNSDVSANICDDQGFPLIALAAWYADKEVIDALIWHGADPDARILNPLSDWNGYTAYHIALERENRGGDPSSLDILKAYDVLKDAESTQKFSDQPIPLKNQQMEKIVPHEKSLDAFIDYKKLLSASNIEKTTKSFGNSKNYHLN